MNKKHFIFIFALILSFSSCFLFRKVEKAGNQIQIQNPDQNSVQVYWIGHATILIKLYDKWILTDPNFSESLGVVVKRYIEPPMEIKDVPELDAVVISHSHFDHLDKATLKNLKIKGTVFVPPGAGTYIPTKLHPQKLEMSPWDSLDLNGLKITAVPARHFGGRWLLDNLWDGDPYTGYIIQYKDTIIYFAGDTGYQKEIFEEIGNKFQIDLALLPVGPSKGPNNPVHINPAEAVQAFQDLQAKKMIPMHFGTFYRSMESELPELQRVLTPLGNKAILLSIGESWTLAK